MVDKFEPCGAIRLQSKIAEHNVVRQGFILAVSKFFWGKPFTILVGVQSPIPEDDPACIMVPNTNQRSQVCCTLLPSNKLLNQFVRLLVLMIAVTEICADRPVSEANTMIACFEPCPRPNIGDQA
jgi:hypothetical protein